MIEVLTNLICRAGDDRQQSARPAIDTRKLHPPESPREHSETPSVHSLGELNVYGIVDPQITKLGDKLVS